MCVSVALAVVAALGMSACASGSTGPGGGASERATAPGPTPLPHITVRRTGGIAGVTDAVTVDPLGAWVATDKAGHRRTGQLTPDQVAAVSAVATDPRLAAEARRSVGPTNCSDAFDYDVTVDALRLNYTDCPTDPGRPDATVALVQQVLKVTKDQ